MVNRRTPVAIAERQARPAGVLLVEDLKTNQILARAILKQAGHEVDIAENGEQAVAAVQRKDYDLVFMDVQMPIMDGLEATRVIRAQGGNAAKIPIVALTASVLQQDVEECRAAGMDDFVAKPLDKETLLAAVERWARPETAESTAEQTGSTGQLPVLDQEKLASLEGLVGPEGVEAMVEMFLSDVPNHLAAITAPGADHKIIEREAHALVSLAGNLGLKELSAWSRKLTDACRSGEDSIPGLIQNLSAAVERAQAHLHERHADARSDGAA
jgi:CheY-like chemotaxis protein/HPt (histidine-containing phosphotransfer) domain-containing protein